MVWTNGLVTLCIRRPWVSPLFRYASLYEKLGDKYGITRAECDEFATRSQNLSEKATAAGVLLKEIEPIEVRGAKARWMHLISA